MEWTPHPALPALTREEMLAMEPERILEYYNTREAAIEAERDDPYRHGFELDTWKLADDALKTHSL